MDNMIYRRTKTVALFKDKSRMDEAVKTLKDAGVYDIHTKKLGRDCHKAVKEEAFLTRKEILGIITGMALGGLAGLVLSYLIASGTVSPPLLIPLSAGGIYPLLFTGLFAGAILGAFIASMAYMILPAGDVTEGDYLLTVYHISAARKKVTDTLNKNFCIII